MALDTDRIIWSETGCVDWFYTDAIIWSGTGCVDWL